MSADRVAAATERVRRLLDDYAPPDFAHVPDPDAAIFLCAVDHRTGYEREHRVGGAGPQAGSELMWSLALSRAASGEASLTAEGLADVSAERVADLFRIEGETVVDPQRRAALWRGLAAGLNRDYGGSAARLLARSDGHLGGSEGLLARLARFRAFDDPLAKKAQLFAKICARRGWLEVRDPQCWEVSADNVLMRLALRAGLVAPGPLAEVRPATRAALRGLAERAGVAPPVLDDLLWERGRDDPDLLGSVAGDLHEPPRDPSSTWY